MDLSSASPGSPMGVQDPRPGATAPFQKERTCLEMGNVSQPCLGLCVGSQPAGVPVQEPDLCHRAGTEPVLCYHTFGPVLPSICQLLLFNHHGKLKAVEFEV